MKRLKEISAAVLRDAAGLAGGGLVSYGSWLLMPAAGFIVAGFLLMAIALLLGRSAA